jgi:hypothetical protein
MTGCATMTVHRPRVMTGKPHTVGVDAGHKHFAARPATSTPSADAPDNSWAHRPLQTSAPAVLARHSRPSHRHLFEQQNSNLPATIRTSGARNAGAMSTATGTPRRDQANKQRIDVPPTAELVPDLQYDVDPVPENHRPRCTSALAPIIRAPRGRQQGLGPIALAGM